MAENQRAIFTVKSLENISTNRKIIKLKAELNKLENRVTQAKQNSRNTKQHSYRMLAPAGGGSACMSLLSLHLLNWEPHIHVPFDSESTLECPKILQM